MSLKAKDLREMTEAELGKKLRDLGEDVIKIRLDKQSGQLEQTHRVREIRRDIARIQTILNEKKLVAAKA